MLERYGISMTTGKYLDAIAQINDDDTGTFISDSRFLKRSTHLVTIDNVLVRVVYQKSKHSCQGSLVTALPKKKKVTIKGNKFNYTVRVNR